MENKKLETYKLKILCINCRERTDCEIPKGKFAQPYLSFKKPICSNCGCKLPIPSINID